MTTNHEDIYGEFWADLAKMINSYLECALWSSYDPEDESFLDSRFGVADIDEDWLREARRDCYEFLVANEMEIGCVCLVLSDAFHGGSHYGLNNVGHDFWLTRNHHGSGFWDRYYGSDQMLENWLDKLTCESETYGEAELLPIDKGLIGS